jgi:arylsulfatase A-like enzyme
VWQAFASAAHYFDYALVDAAGKLTSYGREPEEYSTDVLRDQLLAFMRASLEARRPFFAYFAPFAPHDEPANGFFGEPAPRHFLFFQSLPAARPPNFMEADVSDKPAMVQALPVLDPFRVALLDQHRRRHLETLLAVDETVAAALALLDEFGERRDTLIVFTADNGFAFGEHRRYSKPCPYEECIRVPLVISYPRRIRRPRTPSSPALAVDIAPTILEFARVRPSIVLDGRSLRRDVRRLTPAAQRPVPLEVWASDDTLTWRGVRTRRWKYVDYPATSETELYDLIADPYELENVASNPANADVIADLHQTMLELRAGE